MNGFLNLAILKWISKIPGFLARNWFLYQGLKHARLPCPSLSPGVFSDSCPLSWWCCPSISSSASPFCCLQFFPASGSFPMNPFFASRGQSIGASASVLPMNIQGWSLLGLTGMITWKINHNLSSNIAFFTILSTLLFWNSC